jgi:hypothetical protein
MRIASLAFSILCLASGLAHGETGALKAYMALKQDPDLYVGEGNASDAEFDHDRAKALAAARERARGALAEAISVHVHTESSEALRSQGGKVQEEAQSRSQSQSDLNLDNVHLMELEGFPEAGQVTVMASLSKEDYRRQLAGEKVSVFLPEHGLRLGISYLWPPSMDAILNYASQHHDAGSQADNHVSYALDFLWHSWVLGADFEPTGFGGFQIFSLGYDWTPWATRLQMFVPLRAEIGGAQYNADSAISWGASLGLGLRYWLTDGLAVEASGIWHQAIASGAMNLEAGQAPVFSISGPEAGLSIQWSGF